MTDTPVPTAEPVVSHIAGDRLCASCGFHLLGQPIVREAKYNLLIARCPECGSAAALQEYPALGRWARRWAGLLAAAWLVALLAAALGSAAMLAGPLLAMGDDASRTAAATLARAQNEWYEALPAERKAAIADATEMDQIHAYVSLAPEFLAEQDPAEVLARQGPRWRQIAWPAPGELTVWVMLVVGVSVFWPVALPHRRRWQAALLVLVLWGLGVAMFSGSVGSLAAPRMTGTQGVPAYFFARPLIQPWFWLLIGGGGLALSMIACVFGRPIARSVVRLALPPRLRAPFAFLWHADGKAMPRPSRPAPR